MKRVQIPCLATLLLLFTLTESIAAVVTFQFEGSVTTVIGNISDASSVGVTVGAPIAGVLTFDDSVVDTASNTQLGIYPFSGSPNSFQMTVGLISPSVTDFSIRVFDGVGVADAFDVTNSSPLSAGGFSFFHFRLLLQDVAGTMLSDDALSTSPPDLDMTSTQILQLWEDDGGFASGQEWRLQAEITSLSAVPEPSSLVLLGVGGLGLFVRRCRNYRKCQLCTTS